MAKPNRKKNTKKNVFTEWLSYVHNNITVVNQSKIFAGIVILTLNVSSKFVTIKLGKTMESYLKYTFSRNVLIFAMAWMGTRDIYIALGITLLFTFIMDYLLNEQSRLCCLPDNFMKYHTGLLENMSSSTPPKTPPTAQQIADAIETLSNMKETMNANPPNTSWSEQIHPSANTYNANANSFTPSY